MDKSILNNFLKKNNVAKESLQIWYGFNNSNAGNVLFNEFLPNPSGDTFLANGCVNPSGQPAILIGSGANSFYFNSGSGYFDGESIFKIENVDFLTGANGFTIISNIKNFDNTGDQNKGKTLLTTMKSSTDTSGWAIGINGANRVYFHFTDVNGNANREIQSKHEINNYSIFSISHKPDYSYETVKNIYGGTGIVGQQAKTNFTPSYYDYAYHDIVNLEEAANSSWSVSRYYNRTNVVPSNSLYIGDFYNQSEGYTGYKGHVGDILIFSGALSANQRHEISKAFFAESITPEHVSVRTVRENVITGSGISQIMVTGTGITGYENIDIVSTIPSRDGSASNLQICKTIESGVTGLLSGEVITYTTGSGIQTRTYREVVPESIVYSQSGMKPYAKSNILFFDPVESDELFELYSYNTKNDRINRGTELEFIPANSIHADSPVSICEKFAAAMCTDSSYAGKVCYPCNKYVGQNHCGSCYEITGTVDGPCEETDTCESGFANVSNCKKFVFEECIRRFDAPVGSFDLKTTVMPSFATHYSEDYKFNTDSNFITSGGNTFINGVFTKQGIKSCEQKSTLGLSSSNRSIYNLCNVKSGTYMILDGYKGYYSGTHSFNIRYRYDVYDPTGHRVFNSEDYIYMPAEKEFIVFDDSHDYGMLGSTGEAVHIKYIPDSTNLTLAGNKYLNRDLYLNGLKLTSGFNYIENSSNEIEIIRSTLPDIQDAQISFVARPIIANAITGSDMGNHKNVGFGLLSEQIWINGLRQVEGVNYIKTPKNSLLNTPTILRSHDSNIYSDTEDFFNQ